MGYDSGQKEGRPLVRERVTVINAEAQVADLFRELLSSIGFDAETYADVLPGLDELISSRPALVIVNMDLEPTRDELSGLQVIHSARTSTQLRDIPIIVTTTNPADIAAAWPDLMERGDIHQLAMPFDLDTFLRVVETALGRVHGEVTGRGGAILAEHPAEEQG